MKIVYGMPDRFGKYRLDQPVSRYNPGGGISTKAQRVFQAWSEWYDVEMVEPWWKDMDPRAYLVVDPLSFRFIPEDTELGQVVEAYERHPAPFKVLYGSELAIMCLPFEERTRIFQASTLVTTCCDFQEGLFQALGQRSLRFCDPVPESVFYNPLHEKELSLVVCGSISDCKQSFKVVDIFKALKGKLKLIYVGGADLWGQTFSENERIATEIRRLADEFHYNVSQAEVARIFARASCGIFDTAHETCSESNQEFLMSGGRCYYGLHALWEERPGVHGLEDALSFVSAISSETQAFKALPVPRYRAESETWALEHCSYAAFMQQWKEVVRQCKMNSSTITG